MTSKLFQAVVGVGIAMGAVACAAAPDGGSSAGVGEAALLESSAAPNPAAFCEVAWPTTKGTTLVAPIPACVDPKHECADAGQPSACLEETPDGVCTGEAIFSFCIDGKWQCKPGMRPQPVGEFVGESCRCIQAAGTHTCGQ
jgi:hypothetical protein